MRNFFISRKRHGSALLSALLAAELLAMALGGCADSAGKTHEDRCRIVDDLAQIILVIDSASAVWDDTLDALCQYAQSGSDEDLLTALEAVSTAYDMVLELDYEYTEPSEEYLAILEAEGISAQDYQTLAGIPSSNAMTYTTDLGVLFTYIYNIYYGADTQWDDFVYTCEMLSLEQQYTRQYGWYMLVNNWFAEWEGEDLDYVQEQILDRLTSLNRDGMEWDTSRDSIEYRVNAILDDLEEINIEWETRVEESEDALEDLEKELKTAEEE